MLHKQLNGSCPTFKQFSRKSYALFSCLHSEVRIGVLGVATLTASSVGNISAQTFSVNNKDTLKADDLPEVAVTGTRAPLAADQAARVVSTISRDEIAKSGATSINDLLKLTVGVDVRQRGGFGVQSDISINGGTFDQITILLNGVCVNNPQTGHLAADFPVSPDEIERIEILEGAAGRLLGSQAFSGAINIVTRSEKSDNLHAKLAAGSYGSIESGASLNLSSDEFSHFISGNFNRSDGGTTNSSFNQGKAFYNGKYHDENIKVSWQAGLSTQSYGANTFYSGAFPNQWESTTRILTSVKAETNGKIHFSPTLSWLRSTDHFQLIHNTSKGENFHRGDVYDIGINAWTAWALGRTSIGAELKSENILSTNLGKPRDSTEYVKIHGENGKYYTHSDSRTNISYFAEHDFIFDNLTLSAGLLANRNTAVDEKFHLYPGVDISYKPSETLRLYASWNEAMRLPTFTDLYYKSPTQEGNIGLKPEKTYSTKLGAEFKNRFASATVQGYYSHGVDMIDWVMRSSTDIYHSTSFTLDNFGFSIMTNVDFRKLINENFYVNNLSISYAYINQDRKDDSYVYRSNYALEYLRHKLVIAVDHKIFSRLSAAWTLRWQKREGSYIKYDDGKSTGTLVKYSPYTLINMKLMWNAPKYELYLTADNIISKRYYDLSNVKQPGCWIMAGIKLNLGL